MYRSEHPNPQCRRAGWQNLNGRWEFAFDDGRSGRDRKLYLAVSLPETIEVPFCPQAKLSGIGRTDFLAAVWYRREFSVTEEALLGRVLLHFGAVDYHAYVYVNGQPVGEHIGGYTPFVFDITDACRAGENVLTVCAEDDERNPHIPRGKQAETYASALCDYTRTTGIWQTVWLEFVPTSHIVSFRLYPDAAAGTLRVTAETVGAGTLSVTALWDGCAVGTAEKHTDGGHVDAEIKLSERHLWEVGKGGLYDLVLTFGDDRVESYFGLRDIRYADGKFFLNGRSVFQRLVLDQGFYPDGIYTAPSEDDLAADILLSQKVGFNGARLHEKVFEPLFLYHADRLGYLVWGEYPNWGVDHSDPASVYAVLPEWMTEVERDFNHPSLVGWCPFNETWDFEGRRQDDRVLETVYRVTKAMDPTRPCIDTSGNYHVVTDIYDVHDYEQDVDIFRKRYDRLPGEGVLEETPYIYKCSGRDLRQSWDGRAPVFVSEYGGIRWATDGSGWGYGDAPEDECAFKNRFRGLTEALLNNPKIFALCYTQLYDIEQEQNGLYTYSRKPKFTDMTFFRDVLTKTAAVETSEEYKEM